MTSGYGLRLAILIPACFFAVHLTVGVLVHITTRDLIRRAARRSARAASNLLFFARLAPSSLALAVVIVLCVPSFLLHEQRTAAEGVGPACLIGALLGAGVLGGGLIRAVRALLTSMRFLSQADHARGLIALAGILRPRLVVSRDVVETLTPEQLEAALSHEQAHRISQDNLKRLLILLTPRLFPAWRALDSLEHAWKQSAEFAADDYAAAGDPRRSIDLATALVRVSRLSVSPTPALAASLLDSCGHLEVRISRLLNGPAAAQEPAAPIPVLAAASVLAAALPLLHPAGLLAVHNLLERLIH